MGPFLAVSTVLNTNNVLNKYNKKDYTDMMDNVTSSVGESFDKAFKKLSQSGNKMENYGQQAAAAVYTGALTATAVAGGIAGGVTGGLAGGLATAAGGDWSDVDSFESAKNAALVIAGGASAGSMAGGTIGSTVGGVVGGMVGSTLYKNTPFLDPSGKSVSDMQNKGTAVGLTVAAAGVAIGSTLALAGAVTADDIGKAMGHVEKEAALAMDNALNSGYAYANGLKKTSKDIMKNVESVANDLSKSAGKANKEAQKAINDGVSQAAESVKSFADMGVDALEEAGTMLDKIGIDKLFREETTAEKIASAMGGFMDSIGDSFDEMMEASKEGLVELADLGNEAIVALGLEKEMDEAIAASPVLDFSTDAKDKGLVEKLMSGGALGAVAGAMGKQWVKPHKRAGRKVKGFWRKLRGK